MRALLREGSRIDDPDDSCHGLIDGQSEASLSALRNDPLAGLQGDSPGKVGDCRVDKDQALDHHTRQGSKKSGGWYRAEYRERKRGIFTLLCCVSWPGWTEHRSAFRRSHVASGAYAEFE